MDMCGYACVDTSSLPRVTVCGKGKWASSSGHNYGGQEGGLHLVVVIFHMGDSSVSL